MAVPGTGRGAARADTPTKVSVITAGNPALSIARKRIRGREATGRSLSPDRRERWRPGTGSGAAVSGSQERLRSVHVMDLSATFGLN